MNETNTPRWITVAFGDENRPVRATLAVLAMAGIMAWFAFAGPLHEITFAQCLADPVRWDGKDLILSVQRVHGVEDGYVMVRAGRGLGRVRPPADVNLADVQPGDTISTSGVFRSTGVLEASWFHVHTARHWKNRASLVGMFGALGAGAIVFRWDRRGRGLVERFDDA